MEEEGGFNLYGMVGNNPVDRVDLLGLTSRSDIDADNLIYSTKCGWIDWGHALPGGPADLWSAITDESEAIASLTGEGFHVGYEQDMGSGLLRVAVAGHYFVKHELSEAQKKAVALGIFKEVSDNFENLQANWPFSWISNSGNSEEDRPSNLIAFYRAVEGFSRDQIEG
ncbi:MAG: hypothetical protein ACLFS4_02615, partial [Opitutales bacterium]